MDQLPYIQRMRIRKGQQEPIFLLDDALEEHKLSIAGTTKNVYTVTLDPVLNCNCPDKQTRIGTLCKHICFVLEKIGKFNDSAVYRNHRLSETQINELKFIISKKQFCERQIIDNLLVSKFKKLDTEDIIEEEKPCPVDTECAICFDLITEKYTACKTCNNIVHDACMARWLQNKKTCVYCRSPFALPKINVNKPVTTFGNIVYENLS